MLASVDIVHPVKSISVRLPQYLKQFSKVETLLVFQPLTFKTCKLEQLMNVDASLVTLLISQLLQSIVVILLQPLNILVRSVIALDTHPLRLTEPSIDLHPWNMDDAVVRAEKYLSQSIFFTDVPLNLQPTLVTAANLLVNICLPSASPQFLRIISRATASSIRAYSSSSNLAIMALLSLTLIFL